MALTAKGSYENCVQGVFAALEVLRRTKPQYFSAVVS
jgi:hypothetical protein